jgi:hypothetical protein
MLIIFYYVKKISRWKDNLMVYMLPCEIVLRQCNRCTPKVA